MKVHIPHGVPEGFQGVLGHFQQKLSPSIVLMLVMNKAMDDNVATSQFVDFEHHIIRFNKI